MKALSHSTPAERAARQYRRQARELRRMAALYVVDDPDEQKRIRYYADMAEHAAVMEGRDTPPRFVP